MVGKACGNEKTTSLNRGHKLTLSSQTRCGGNSSWPVLRTQNDYRWFSGATQSTFISLSLNEQFHVQCKHNT
eukprot:1371944-Amorphochlora_amoeboformis.AAC.1